MSKKIKIFILLLLIILPCLIMGYAHYEAMNVQIKEMVFSHKDIPPAFDGKKVVFVSDIHFNRYFAEKELASLVNRINGLNPDVILLGGDYISSDTLDVAPLFASLAKLQAKYGVYSVLGNHDHWEDASLMQAGLENSGIHIADNNSFWIKEGADSIKIGGVGDFWEDEQLIENTINDIKTSDFCILLSHNPDYMEVLDSEEVDLMLSGHTHAGQGTFFGLWAPIMPSSMHQEYIQTGQKYRYGWKQKGEISLYVSSGVGMGKIPFRFFAWPEIAAITLKKK
ncbi:metallophosphoesterase [Dysgonomonas sp. 511]|uniref:metallophosphoesterase n=1 Tax=Dysgonomonas sp. 511 TaxID=2302930 RepID=UPI0013D86DA9|nr:metallophosphoesterase [Dysgonomonas sp. 511]NDV79076.1 metallophosphoesterase [Dysgonomonas sp. 511]